MVVLLAKTDSGLEVEMEEKVPIASQIWALLKENLFYNISSQKLQLTVCVLFYKKKQNLEYTAIYNCIHACVQGHFPFLTRVNYLRSMYQPYS